MITIDLLAARSPDDDNNSDAERSHRPFDNASELMSFSDSCAASTTPDQPGRRRLGEGRRDSLPPRSATVCIREACSEYASSYARDF